MSGGDIAARAAGYVMPGVAVDGQDVIAMYEVAKEAIGRARKGEGPTLIEAQTYRYQGHFGADDPLGYRDQEEEDYYENRDCISRLRDLLIEDKLATEEQLKNIEAYSLEAIKSATKFANDSPFPESDELVTDVYVSYK